MEMRLNSKKILSYLGMRVAAVDKDEVIGATRRILINITGSGALGLHEVNEACNIVRDAADCDDLQINFGVISNDLMGDAVKVTVIATGFQSSERAAEEPFFLPVPVRAEAAPEQFAAPVAAAEEEHEEEAPAFIDPDDLDVPAYLRNNNAKQIM